jgi:hypothetical protein
MTVRPVDPKAHNHKTQRPKDHKKKCRGHTAFINDHKITGILYDMFLTNVFVYVYVFVYV